MYWELAKCSVLFVIMEPQPTDKCSRCLRKTNDVMDEVPVGSNLVHRLSDCDRGGEHNWVSIAPPIAPGNSQIEPMLYMSF